MLGHLTSAKHRAWHIPTTSGWAPVCSVQTGELQTSSHNLPVSNGCSCCAWMWFTPQRSLGAARAPLHEPCPLCLASFALCVSSLPLHTPPAQPRQSPYFSVCLHQPSSFPGRWRSTVLTPPNLQVFPALFISISLRLKHQPPPPPPPPPVTFPSSEDKKPQPQPHAASSCCLVLNPFPPALLV